MVGVDGGSDFWLISILNRVFQCWHRRQSRPITPRGGGETYAVCLDCGTRVAYDLSAMRAEASVLGISLGRQTPEGGKKDISDIPEHPFIALAPGRRERTLQDSRRVHRDFGTTAVLCIGAMSLAGGLFYLPNRPGLRLEQRFHMRGCGRGQPAQVVASFQHRDQPPFGVLGRDAQDGAGQVGEILVGKREPPQQVFDA